MCGILAILLSHLKEDELRAMGLVLTKKLRHRGPDWNGISIQRRQNDGLLSLMAHERLAIVDPCSGHQPLFDSSGDVCVTINGEIYNHKELIRDVIGAEGAAALASHSDCAVVPPLFARMQEKFVPLLDGIFAFVASNQKTGEILAARDPIGICPLYMGWDADGAIWFASEMKALTGHCCNYKIFPPGHFYSSTANRGKGGLVRYYEPVWWSLSSPPPTADLDLVKIRDAFTSAVNKRLMSDVPFGVLLSGGLDSSIVAAIMSREYDDILRAAPKDCMLPPSLHSFTIGLEGSPDLLAARTAAKYLKTRHHEFTFTVQKGLDSLRDVIYHLETYDVTTIRASVPLYLLSRLIRALGIKFVLSGEGADEVFGGYLYFHKAPNKEELHRETIRKIQSLYYYDVLRANKAPMAFGLEVRVPFLDKSFLDVAMGFDPKDKMCKEGRIEKWALRSAFEGYLPHEILWRQKEQFSDGVGYSWIDGLKAHAEKSVSSRQMELASVIFPHNTPTTKEAFLYRSIFASLFPEGPAAATVPGGPSIACSSAAAIDWDASFRTNADQSGRSVVGVHQAGIQFADALAAAAL